MTGRRATHRQALTADIRAAALRRLCEHGPTGMTMRGVAADLDLSPGALYRYYDGLDGLLTALIADGYRHLADALARADTDESNTPKDPVDRLRAVCRAYRSWALAHPHHFDLVFGTPIPGYSAPVAGPTTEAMEQLGAAMFRPAIEALHAGRLAVSETFAIDEPGNMRLVEAMRQLSGSDIPPAFGAWAMAIWGQLHGLVALELNGQFRWMYGDDAGAQYDAAVDGFLAAASRGR